MAQLSDDCFAFDGPLMPLDDALAELAARVRPVVEEEAVPLTAAAGRILARDVTATRRLERDVLRISEREKTRIGRDLHDGLGQQLTGLALLGRALAGKLSARAVPEADDATQLADLIHRAVIESRGLARGLDPITEDAEGLAAALDDGMGTYRRRIG